MRRAALRDYVTLARPSYWVKSVFILPGTIAAVLFGLGPVPWDVLGALGRSDEPRLLGELRLERLARRGERRSPPLEA